MALLQESPHLEHHRAVAREGGKAHRIGGQAGDVLEDVGHPEVFGVRVDHVDIVAAFASHRRDVQQPQRLVLLDELGARPEHQVDFVRWIHQDQPHVVPLPNLREE